MLSKSGTYSVIIVPGDHSGTRQYRVSRRLIIGAIAAAVITILTFIFFVATYGSVLSKSRRVSGLEQENQELRSQVVMINQLNDELENITALRAQLVEMLGETPRPDFDEVLGTDHSARLASLDADALDHLRAAQLLREYSPTAWPIDGLVRREFVPGEDRHPGLAIDAAAESAVQAAGRGRVIEVGHNEKLGNFAVLDHGFGFTTVYARAERIVVEPHQRVDRGQIIAYLGTSNLGSEAQLYFEIRVDGEPVNPRSYLRTENSR